MGTHFAPACVFRSHNAPIVRAIFDNDDYRKTYSIGMDSQVISYDIINQSILSKWSLQRLPTDICSSDNCFFVASGTNIIVFDTRQSNHAKIIPTAHIGGVTSVDIAGQSMSTAGYDGFVRIFDLRQGLTKIEKAVCVPYGISSISWGANDERIFAGGLDGTCYILDDDLSTVTRLVTNTHFPPVYHAVPNPNIDRAVALLPPICKYRPSLWDAASTRHLLCRNNKVDHQKLPEGFVWKDEERDTPMFKRFAGISPWASPQALLEHRSFGCWWGDVFFAGEIDGSIRGWECLKGEMKYSTIRAHHGSVWKDDNDSDTVKEDLNSGPFKSVPIRSVDLFQRRHRGRGLLVSGGGGGDLIYWVENEENGKQTMYNNVVEGVFGLQSFFAFDVQKPDIAYDNMKSNPEIKEDINMDEYL